MAKFPFGTNTPYYDNREPEKETSNNLLGIAGLGLSGAGLFASGAIPVGQGNMFDVYYKGLRTIGHASPFGIVSSLRIPELISPFTSEHFKSGGTGPTVFHADYFSNSDTVDYLAKVTGRSRADLTAAGIGSGASVRFERGTGVHGAMGRGRLVAFAPGMTDRVLSDNISLFERQHAAGDIFSPRTSTNPLAEGIINVLGENFDINKLFQLKDPVTGEMRGIHQWIPVPSITGSAGTWSDLVSRLAIPRGWAAFEAQRVIKATETLGENVPFIGETFLKPIISRLNLPKGGTATKTYLRLGGFGAKVAMAGMAVAEFDWFMRYQADDNVLTREMGYTASSGVIGLLAGWVGRSVKGKGVPKLAQLGSINQKAFAIAGIAAFIGQNLLPGFDKGVVAGASQTISSTGTLRSRIGEVTGMNTWRRNLEETFPGISANATGFFAAGLHYAAFRMLTPGQGRYARFMSHLKHDTGITSAWGAFKAGFKDPNRFYESWEKVSYDLPLGKDLDAYKAEVAAGTARKPTMHHQLENEDFAERMMSPAEYRAKKGLAAGTVIPAHVGVDSGLPLLEQWNKIANHLGSNIHAQYAGKATGKLMFTGGTLAALGGFLLHHVATTGGLGTTETPEQLERISTGEEWVPVNKSRFWGGGGTPWEGNKISHFRPSMNAMIQADVDNQAVWGEDAAGIDPIRRFAIKNFTNYLEEKHYYDRPYPISAPAFSDFPILGSLLGSTIGSLIKSPKIMHGDEWIRSNEDGSASFLTVPRPLDSNPNRSMGGTGMGTPVSPHSIGYALSQSQYQFRELQGLTGFVKNTLQEAATGSETFVPTSPVLASSSDMTSLTDAYWDLELGGQAGMTEIVRRFLPKDRFQTRNRYNPLRNEMPGWIPEEFHTGDPYAKLASGNARLPGAGFAALYPELQGIDAENYPLWAKYQILASISPYSAEFRTVQQEMYQARSQGLTPDSINRMVDTVDQQLLDYRQKRNFWQPGPENEDDGVFQNIARNSYFALIDNIKKFAAPIEYLSPFRPFQKFLPTTTALKDYENYYVYGSETAMWKPAAAIREFIGPSFLAGARIMGYGGVPPDVTEKREINEYFDKLTYYKYMNLAIQAKKSGQGRKAYEYEKYAHKTVYGVNPFGHALSIYAALPDAEKTHFEAFANASISDRERIWELIPKDQQKIFAAMWARKDGVSDSIAKFEGMSGAYHAEYQSSGQSKFMSYPDYARMKELEQYFNSTPPPREDWVGWRCLPPDQEIISKDLNVIEVSDFQTGYPVWQTGIINSVQEVMMRNCIEENMYTLTVSRDRVNTMSATENHKILAWKCPWKVDHLRRKINNKVKIFENDFTPEWIKIENLTESDYLVIPIKDIITKPNHILDVVQLAKDAGWDKVYYDDQSTWVYYKDKSKANLFPRFIEITDDLVWLIGYYLAEGHTLYRGGKERGVEFTSNLQQEEDVRDKCLSILNDLKIEGAYKSKRARSSGSSGSVRVNNCLFGLIIQYFAPGKSYSKEIHNLDYLITSKNRAIMLLSGYFVGDGSKESSASVAVTTSRKLAYQIYELLISCKIIPSFSFEERKNKHDVWTLRFVRNYENAIKLHDNIVRKILKPHVVSFAKPKAFIINNYLFSKISKITSKKFNGIVYDLNIKNLHEYRCSIGLYHNSEVDLNDVKLNYVKQEGWDIHDFNMWESQESMIGRKPYLEGAEQEIEVSTSGYISQIKRLINRSEYKDYYITENRNAFLPSSSVVYIEDDRENEIKKEYRKGDEQ